MPSPGDHPNPGIEPRFPALQADSLPAEPPNHQKNLGMSTSVSHLSHTVPSVGLSQHLSVIFVIPAWIPKAAGKKNQENFQVN